MRIHIATGSRFARIDGLDAGAAPRWALEGPGAQCLAVDLGDPDRCWFVSAAQGPGREHGEAPADAIRALVVLEAP